MILIDISVFKGGECMENKTNDSESGLKKLTLKGWAKILLNEGMIDMDRYNRMIFLIDKLTA